MTRSSLLRKWKVAPPRDFFLAGVGALRHMQATREKGSLKNPDTIVGTYLGPIDRMRIRFQSLKSKRSSPFYSYLLARTLYYDDVFLAQVQSGIEQILFFGVGTDTRSHRFASELNQNNVRVIETDLLPWIAQRARLAQKLTCPRDLHHIPLDLESRSLKQTMQDAPFDWTRRSLFFAEGVTPYISPAALECLFASIGDLAPSGSVLAYDGKYQTDQDTPYCRFPRNHEAIKNLHERFGLELKPILDSNEVQATFIGRRDPAFCQDLVLIAVKR